MSSPEGSIAALSALWAESERRMYPLATTTPHKYEQLVRLARAISDDLDDVQTGDALSERWGDASELVQRIVASTGLALGDLPESDVAGIGFSLRHREIRQLEHERDLRARVEKARSSGSDWALLHETGDLEQGLMNAYQAIELHLGSGAALVSSVEQSPVNGQANYVLTVILLDPETGATVDIDPGIVDIREHDSAELYTASRLELRQIVEELPSV